MSVKFYLSPQENRFGECPVRVSVSIRGARLVSTVGYSISRDDWKNFRKDSSDDSFPFQTVVHDGVNASGIPFGTISSRIHDIYTHFSGYESSIDHKPSKEELSAELAKVKNGRKPAGAYVTSPTAVNYFDRFVKMESRRCEWSERTIVSWHAFRQHLVAMGDKIMLEDFCNKGLDSFLNYLRKDCGMKESTVRKVFSELKWFLRWCIRKDYTDETAICEYDPKIMVIKDPIVFLTRDELLNMYNFRVPEEYRTVTLTNFEGRRYKKEVRHSRELNIVKDLFCFCSFTSLLFSELNSLKECNIQDDDSIVFDRRSERNARLELNDYSVAILEKYRLNAKHPWINFIHSA